MNTTSKTQSISMSRIRDIYNPGEGRHWFDRASMRFFRSRLPGAGVEGPGGIFFVSSEQGPHENSPRRYSVRQLKGEGDIKTVGEFCGYWERAEAMREARRLASITTAEVLQRPNQQHRRHASRHRPRVARGGRMKTRGIIGQRIVAVSQTKWHPGSSRAAVNVVNYIELEDGTRIIPAVIEGEADYGVEFVVNKQHRRKSREEGR